MPESSEPERVLAEPPKRFFIDMLTKDIELEDCVLDLLDNCVDGASRKLGQQRKKAREPDYSEFSVKIGYDQAEFQIADNCGGIPIDLAKQYAFRFGRPDDAPASIGRSIGLYGIGMKRAMLKIGDAIHVTSSTGSESFELTIDVPEWRAQPAWDFEMTNVQRGKTKIPQGTTITVRKLRDGIGKRFLDPSFTNKLIRSIERDYALILHRGLTVSVNSKTVSARFPKFKSGEGFEPLHQRHTYDGVDIDIVVGLAASPPEDDSSETRYPDVDVYGWYVACNDRVVVAADKTDMTGWGRGNVPSWHPQYLGFCGVVRFDSGELAKLPWKTTKRAIDTSSPVYQAAIPYMADATRQFVQYTNQRKSYLDELRAKEKKAVSLDIWDVKKTERKLVVPKVKTRPMVSIQYDKPKAEVEAVGRALGLTRASARAVGIATFDYAKKRELKK